MDTHARPMTVVQMLPALDSGGVERGTLEVARELVRRGHRSIVIAKAGRLRQQLIDEGSEHVDWSVGSKSPLTLRWVVPLRRLLRQQRVDVLHARSRMPAWIAYLAWQGMRERSASGRPRFVTTMHGLHSVNAYSAIMTRGEKVIAVSRAVKQHIKTCYPKTPEDRVQVIPRGVDPEVFAYELRPQDDWLQQWYDAFPMLRGRRLLLLPGRLTRLKGHAAFVQLIARLKQDMPDIMGVIVGGDDPKRQSYAREIRELAQQQTPEHVVFTGHRSDMREIYAISSIVFSLSNKPESFGRTVLEALSMGVPVIGYDHGGVGEVLETILPAGRVALHDMEALEQRTRAFLSQPPTVPRRQPYTLATMLDQEIALYESLACEASPQGGMAGSKSE